MIHDEDNDTFAGAAFVLGENTYFALRMAHTLIERWPRERRRTMTHDDLVNLLMDAGEINMAFAIDNVRDQMKTAESVTA